MRAIFALKPELNIPEDSDAGLLRERILFYYNFEDVEAAGLNFPIFRCGAPKEAEFGEF